eukprot:TRINITY_DN17307_c0_g1_i3.p1 TRINITY_DN17307_c0_g1~~TRINITY_DN17307_c0_g1_i3.p1  ORF type:complete len:548 (+),score=136.64 TRINITY_DN17307_c0_g1_i3:195-1838(+)
MTDVSPAYVRLPQASPSDDLSARVDVTPRSADGAAREDSSHARHSLVHDKFTTAMDQEIHLRRRNFGKKLNMQQAIAEEVDPSGAMQLLLRHVHMDPDGGILNLDDGHADVNHVESRQIVQTSKVWALRKSGVEIPLAVLGLFRSLTNPLCVLFFSLHMLHGILMDADFQQKLDQHSRTLGLDGELMERLFVFTSVMELCGIVLLAVKAGLSACRAAMCKCRQNSLPKAGDMYMNNAEEPMFEDKVASPLYVHLAAFWWEDMPLLQSFSALRPLSFVHPNLVGRNFKEFSIKNEMSCRVLEKVLRVKEDQFHEGFLVQGAMRLVHLEEASSGTMTKNAIEEALSKSPYEALCELQMCEAAKDEAKLVEEGVDVQALHKAWRVHAIKNMNTFGFMVLSMVFTAWGMAAFYTKTFKFFFALAAGRSMWFTTAYFLCFLNQIISIVPVNELLKWRVTVFIFGGTDAAVSAEERYVMKMYMAVLAEKVWQSSSLSFWQKVFVMLMFDDDDIQQLVIEEGEASKSSVILAVKRYMATHGAQTIGSQVASWVL